jgi:fatty acid desaturase
MTIDPSAPWVAVKPGRKIETPTIALAVVIYGAWFALTGFHAAIPTPILMALGGWLIAWHGSLQHEIIHGHPTPWRRLNHAIGFAPLSLWLPFEIYRRSHLAHHATEHLTDPRHDPESRYLAAEGGLSPLARWTAPAKASLLGRVVLGPVLEIPGFLIQEARLLATGRQDRPRLWATHAVGVAVIALWLGFNDLSLSRYLICFVYPGAALSLIRSFAEHRADPDPARRVAVVERAPLLGLLFLNNNLHAAHHDSPGTPWYALPDHYARERGRLLAANGGLVYRGYADVARRYGLCPRDPIVHPSFDDGARP